MLYVQAAVCCMCRLQCAVCAGCSVLYVQAAVCCMQNFTVHLFYEILQECGLLEAHSEAVLHVMFSPGTLGKLSVPFSVEFSNEEVDNVSLSCVLQQSLS